MESHRTSDQSRSPAATPRSTSVYEWILAASTTDRRTDGAFLLLLLGAEAILCTGIVRLVSYTEIDWQAYMQQVETVFLRGERDYLQIRGGTGPLVYPAGFLYLFAAIREWVMSNVLSFSTSTAASTTTLWDDLAPEDASSKIRKAQCVFAVFYLATQLAVWWGIYQPVIDSLRQQQRQKQPQQESRLLAVQIWSWRIAIACTCLSKRVHSIFVLRLFNDGPTMLLLYCAIYLFSRHYNWNAGCYVFSLAVSIKMNVLLFAPGLLLLLLQASDNLWHVVYRLAVFCALPQLILGAPFLWHHPIHYLRKAFELDRVFFYKWTVNWKFLPEDMFISKPLSVLLLMLHLGGLAYFCAQWLSVSLRDTAAQEGKPRRFFVSTKLSPVYIISTLLVSNYVGICFARTLHYQFYAWYFHALPFLLWCNTASSTSKHCYPIIIRIILLLAIEVAFLTFPATPTSSAILQLSHIAILVQIRPPSLFLPGTTSNSSHKID